MQQTVELFECDDRQLGSVISDLLRALDFERAERVLSDALAQTPSKMTDTCLRLKEEAITFSGWDRVFAEFTKLQQRGKHITAIGIDISGHDGDGDDPAIELSFYNDSEFPFSTSNRDEILAACPAYSPPWTGCFVDITDHLVVHGASELHLALRNHPNRYGLRDGPIGQLPSEDCAFKLAQWWMYLRFHQALYREISERGLPQKMPVVLCEHDYGPWFGNVLMAEKVADHADQSERILSEEMARNKAHYAKITADAVRDLREHRALALSIRAEGAIGKMGPLLDLNESQDAMVLSISDIKITQPTWQMSDAAFEALLDGYQSARDPAFRPSPRSSASAPTLDGKPLTTGGFGRKGLSNQSNTGFAPPRSAQPVLPSVTAKAENNPPANSGVSAWSKTKLYLLFIVGLPVAFGLKNCAASALGF